MLATSTDSTNCARVARDRGRSVRLVGAGKLWGELRIEDGRLLLDAKRNGRHVCFDLLASVEKGQAVTNDTKSRY